MRLAALLIVTFLPSAARCECSITRAALLPLTLWQDKAYIIASIEGDAVPMFIDTGAAATTLSQSVAGRLNLERNFDHAADILGVGGRESHLGIVEARSFSLADLRYTHKAFPVAKFTDRLADGSAPGGLIGADILSHFDLDVDLAHRQLGLWRVSGCEDARPSWAGGRAPAELEVQPSGHVTALARVDGVALDLMLDTGSPGLVLSTRAAARAGATPEILEQGRTLEGRGINERSFQAWRHVFGRVSIGSEVFGDVGAIVVGGGRLQTGDGLLGLMFFKRNRVWISYATAKLYFGDGRD